MECLNSIYLINLANFNVIMHVMLYISLQIKNGPLFITKNAWINYSQVKLSNYIKKWDISSNSAPI